MAAKPSLALRTEIFFGAGRSGDLPEIVGTFGRTVLLVTGRGSLEITADRMAADLRRAGLAVTLEASVDREPSLAMVENLVERARACRAEVLLGLGGGSCLDAVKAVAVSAPEDRRIDRLFRQSELPESALPWVAVPTTAGSGAEVTPNAVLIDEEGGIKQSIRGACLLARAAVVDPTLAFTLPPLQTAQSGMDALSHAVEALASTGANEITDTLALSAAGLIQANLPLAYNDGHHLAARTAMAQASLLAGIALAQARLGLVHGLAHPLGVLYNLPHGLVCGILLPQVMCFNMQKAFEKYARLAKAWSVSRGGDVYDEAADAIRNVIGLARRLGLPSSLAATGLKEKDFPSIVQATLASGSTAANPRAVGADDVLALLRENLHGHGS